MAEAGAHLLPLTPLGRGERFNSIEDVERAAARRLPRVIFESTRRGQERDLTWRENARAFEAVRFRPRAAAYFERRKLATSVLETPISLPVLLAPVGMMQLTHPHAELTAARAAGASGTICAVSFNTGLGIEAIAGQSSAPIWQQLYMSRGRGAVEHTVARAAAAGCAALVVTVDVNAAPPNAAAHQLTINLRNAVRHGPDLIAHPRWLMRWIRDGAKTPATILGPLQGAAVPQMSPTWEDIRWIRGLWAGPMIVKGILSGDDARRALDEGANAIVVSNHGGRALDGAPASLQALPEVIAAVGGAIDVLLDGGVRRGSDVVKAIALGARAVQIGRPQLWGLGAAGAAGVHRVIEIFRAEIDATLGLLGCGSIADLNAS